MILSDEMDAAVKRLKFDFSEPQRELWGWFMYYVFLTSDEQATALRRADIWQKLKADHSDAISKVQWAIMCYLPQDTDVPDRGGQGISGLISQHEFWAICIERLDLLKAVVSDFCKAAERDPRDLPPTWPTLFSRVTTAMEAERLSLYSKQVAAVEVDEDEWVSVAKLTLHGYLLAHEIGYVPSSKEWALFQALYSNVNEYFRNGITTKGIDLLAPDLATSSLFRGLCVVHEGALTQLQRNSVEARWPMTLSSGVCQALSELRNRSQLKHQLPVPTQSESTPTPVSADGVQVQRRPLATPAKPTEATTPAPDPAATMALRQITVPPVAGPTDASGVAVVGDAAE
jgi:hypothetical protein